MSCALFILSQPDMYLKACSEGIRPSDSLAAGRCELLLRSCEIRKCVEHIHVDWQVVERMSDHEVMLRNARFGRFSASAQSSCRMVYSYSIDWSHVLITVLMLIDLQIGNVTVITYLLPCPFYTELIDTRYSSVNEIMLSLQLLSTIIVNFVTVGAPHCGLHDARLWTVEYPNDKTNDKTGGIGW